MRVHPKEHLSARLRASCTTLSAAAVAAALVLGACGSDGAGGSGGDAAAQPPDAIALLDAATPSDAEVAPESSVVFDESKIHNYDISVADADWQWLNDNVLLEQYVPATLLYEGVTYDQMAIRYKGAFGSLRACFDQQGNRRCDKLSFKLKFSEYDPAGRFFGLKRVNLHSMNADPSKMHDALGYKLFRDASVYAPRTAFARVTVNGEFLGVFIAVEAVDGRFTRSRFPDGGKGNLYKEVWPEHDSEQPYIDALKTNETPSPSAAKMLRFASALSAAGDAGFEATLASWTDLDRLVSYMAVARLIDHWDGTVAWYCFNGGCRNHNYYWYESTAADKVWLVPWDLDHTFEEPSPVRARFGMPDWDVVTADCAPISIFAGVMGRAPACDPFLRRFVTQLWTRYEARSNELIAGAFSATAMEARIDELEMLLAAVVGEDPVLPIADWRAAVMNLRASVAAKRSYIAAKFN